ncbi:hypothetical protein [Stakelama tenebrarum]|uniref:Lipocalin-like domain-containing protein n=1 Tax=Stakelama tenebrarum TaxID=2711215 RepID=A0A6G6YAM2_9SPHN|nr:hypothetical protein [Sphingosinithalassobacter tenebrarum]QIG81623.1 hypothetical protein G5C33_18740 [Sphingosinithalassobacter tenebrarum]
MLVRTLSIALPAIALAACSAGETEADTSNVAVPGVAEATPAAAPADAPAEATLESWIVGTWSFDEICGSSDFAVVYHADGAVDNGGQVGQWALEGNRLTETVTREYDLETGNLTALDTPLTRSYTIVRRDAGHGVIRFNGDDIPILRC